MNAWRLLTSLNREQRNTFLASFLGWTLDAFDFFLVSFVSLEISKDLKVAVPLVALSVTLTLAMRPLGALIFGILAERFGRRLPLMIDIVFYSIIELLTAFPPIIPFSSFYASCSASAWAENGELALRLLWSRCQPSRADSSPASCNRDMRLAI